MHGNSNENQRNKIIDRPHLGKTTFSFLFLFFWGGGGGVGGGGGGGGGGGEESREVRHGPFQI